MNHIENDYDFVVSQVINVVERREVSTWNMHNLVFPASYVMLFTLEGECTYTIEKENYCSKADDVYIFAPGVMRSGVANPQKPWSFISINFEVQNFSGSPVLLPGFITGLTTGAENRVRDLFLKISSLWINREPAFLLKCRTLIQSILCELIIHNGEPFVYTPHYKEIISAKKYIEENYTTNINFQELALSSGLGPSQFRKLFRQVAGCSPNQYAIALRLNKAKSLLETGEVNVSEASNLCGFSDVYYFSTLYKKKMGVSPITIRKGSR